MTARGDLALDAEPEANLPTPPVDIPVHRPPEHRPRLRPSWAPPECVFTAAGRRFAVAKARASAGGVRASSSKLEGGILLCERCSDGLGGTRGHRHSHQAASWAALNLTVLPGWMARMRHASVLLERHRRSDVHERSDEHLWLFFSRVGDAPERILAAPLSVHALVGAADASCGCHTGATRPAGGSSAVSAHPPDVAVDAAPPPAGTGSWVPAWSHLVATPTHPYEGIDVPLARSAQGAAKHRKRELRDPEPFRDDDGTLYLFYAGAGEATISGGLLSRRSCRAKVAVPVTVSTSWYKDIWARLSTSWS